MCILAKSCFRNLVTVVSNLITTVGTLNTEKEENETDTDDDYDYPDEGAPGVDVSYHIHSKGKLVWGLITPTEGRYVFASICLSVCLL